MSTPKEDIDLLVHKAVDQLSVIKASTAFIVAGGNGDSLSDLKTAVKRLKRIQDQIAQRIDELEKSVKADGGSHS